MRFDYLFLMYMLYAFYSLYNTYTFEKIRVQLYIINNRAITIIERLFRKSYSRTNLIRASTLTRNGIMVNARGTLRRWAGTNKYLLHKIGDILKVVNRSAGFY